MAHKRENRGSFVTRTEFEVCNFEVLLKMRKEALRKMRLLKDINAPDVNMQINLIEEELNEEIDALNLLWLNQINQ